MPDDTKTYVAFTDEQLGLLLVLLKRISCYESLSDAEREVLAIVQKAAREVLE